MEEKLEANKKELIQAMSDSQKSTIDQITASMSSIISGEISKQTHLMQTELGKIRGTTDKLSADTQLLAAQLKNVTDSQSSLINAVNNLSQANLNNSIDITGLNQITPGLTPHQTAIQVLRSFNINYDSQITDVIIRDITVDEITKPLIMVTFSSYDVKMKVMNAKRNFEKPNKTIAIYFNHSLTPANRKLFLDARRVGKNHNLTAGISRGRIYLRKQNEQRGVPIRTADDLTQIVQQGGITVNTSQQAPQQAPQSSQPISKISN